MRQVYFQTAAANAASFINEDKQQSAAAAAVTAMTSVNWTDGQSGALSCVSVGGYPPPTVDVYMDSQDISHQLTLSRTAGLHGVKGLRRIHYLTHRSDHTTQTVLKFTH